MKYLASDFYFLTSAAERKSHTVEGAYETMCTYMGYPVSMPCLLHTVRGLVAGGYIRIKPDGNIISAATPLEVTPEGRKLVAISPIQKIFGEYKAHCKNAIRFCDTDRPEVSEDGLTADQESFADCVTRLIRAGDISLPWLEIHDSVDGYVKLTIHHPNDGWQSCDNEKGDEGENTSGEAVFSYSASVTGTTEQIKAGLRDLIHTAHLLVTEPTRSRKVALHGTNRSLLISLANAVNEQGLVTFRMTVSQIRFNRQRFVGKRDSDLDYAQCGDPILIDEMSSAQGFSLYAVYHGMLARPDLLCEDDLTALNEVYACTH